MNLKAVRGVVADLDGVLTSTAALHFAAWRRAWDELRGELGAAGAPPLSEADYRERIDGRPRYEGAGAFLRARGLALPRGAPDDPPGAATVCGFGNHKDALYQQLLAHAGVEPFPDALARLQEWRARGIPVALATASRNGRRVVEAARLGPLLEAQLDGQTLVELGLAGKQELFAEAARRLGLAPADAALLEDSAAGLEAAARAGFGLRVAVARGGRRDLDRLADVTVPDLLELRLPSLGPARRRPSSQLPELAPEAAPWREGMLARLRGYEPALFLDFDGTLSPIVADPAAAALDHRARAALIEAAARVTVCVVSGRDRADVAARVGLPGLTYAGSHGMDIAGPTTTLSHPGAEAALAALDEAEATLRRVLRGVPGAIVERKRFGIAVHYRQVEGEAAKGRVQQAATEVQEASGGRLRQSWGKEVTELQPPIDWDKGRAVEFLLDRLGLAHPHVLPIYVGDDLTDEDAFEALGERGIGVLVGSPDRPTHADYRLPEDPGAVAWLIRATARQGLTHGVKAA